MADRNTNNKEIIGSGVGSMMGGIIGGVVGGISTGGSGIVLGFQKGSEIGGETGKHITKATNAVTEINKVVSNPFSYFINISIEKLVNFLFPIPFISEIISQSLKRYKLMLLMVSITLVLLLTVPFSTFQSNSSVAAKSSWEVVPFELPSNLISYRENRFKDTSVPSRSPFGGDGLTFTQITAGFYDPNYYKIFKRLHDGIDLVPSAEYYNKNVAYKLIGETVLFSTLNGKACSYGDAANGYTIEITSEDNEFKTLYHHQKYNFIPIKKCSLVKAGDPIGIMGATGNATGAHVHYMVYKKVNGKFVAVDPISFI